MIIISKNTLNKYIFEQNKSLNCELKDEGLSYLCLSFASIN